MAGHGKGQDKGGGGGRGKEFAAASYSLAQLPYMSPADFYGILEAKVENLRIPTIDGKPVDLHRIFVEVASRGGIDKVIKNGQLKEVCFTLPQRVTPPDLHKVYMLLLRYLEDDFDLSQNYTSTGGCSKVMTSNSVSEPQLGSSASPGSVHGVDKPVFNLKLALQEIYGKSPSTASQVTGEVVSAHRGKEREETRKLLESYLFSAPQRRFSAHPMGLPSFYDQQWEPHASSVPQPGFSAHPSPAQYYAAPQPSSSATPHGITEPKLTFPEAQVAAKRQRTATGSLPGAPQPCSSAIPEAQGAAKRQGTATCSSPGDTLTSVIYIPMEDPPPHTLQSWLDMDSATLTKLLQITPPEHWALNLGTPAEVKEAVYTLEFLMSGDKTEDTSSKRDSEGDKNEDTEDSTLVKPTSQEAVVKGGDQPNKRKQDLEEEKFEATQRKLQQRHQQAEDSKKRTRLIKLQDVPKQELLDGSGKKKPRNRYRR